MICIKHNTRSYYLPAKWNELTTGQLLSYCRIISSASTQLNLKLRLLKYFTGIKWKALLHIPHAELEEKVYPHLDFLFKDVLLTEPKLPVLRAGWLGEEYISPGTGYMKVRAREFYFTDTFFIRYISTKDESYLDKMIAVLYRPRKAAHLLTAMDYDGDKRVPFNENLVEPRMKWAAALKPEVKQAILLWYMGCRRTWQLRHPELFTKDMMGKVNRLGWKDVINEMAGGKFGSLNETYETFMSEILMECSRVMLNKAS